MVKGLLTTTFVNQYLEKSHKALYNVRVRLLLSISGSHRTNFSLIASCHFFYLLLLC